MKKGKPTKKPKPVVLWVVEQEISPGLWTPIPIAMGTRHSKGQAYRVKRWEEWGGLYATVALRVARYIREEKKGRGKR